MNIYTIFILVVIGLVTGAFGGMYGIGGTTILIPALILFAGLDEHQAIGPILL